MRFCALFALRVSHIVENVKYNWFGVSSHIFQFFVSSSFTICSIPYYTVIVFTCLFVFVYRCVRFKFIAISKSLFHFDFDFELKYPIWNLVVKKKSLTGVSFDLWMSIFNIHEFSVQFQSVRKLFIFTLVRSNLTSCVMCWLSIQAYSSRMERG